MTIEEITNAIAELDDSGKAEIAKQFMTDDSVRTYLTTENGKKVLQPIVDSNFTKGLETWKTNNLNKIVDAKVKELYPEKDEKDIELSQLKQEFEAMKNAAQREKMVNYAIKYAAEKNLPTDIIDYFVGADEETTKANLEKLEGTFANAVGATVTEKLKEQYVPPKNDDTISDPVAQAFYKMNADIKTNVEE